LAPALSWTPMRRVSVKLSEKLAYESVSTASNATVSFLRNTPGLTISYIAQPYLVLSSSVAYELEKKSSDADSLKKASASISILGLL